MSARANAELSARASVEMSAIAIAALALLVLASEGASAESASGAAARIPSREVTIQPGDTLMLIAFRNYGDIELWPRLQTLNAGRIRDPHHLIPGTRLKVDDLWMVRSIPNPEELALSQTACVPDASRCCAGEKWSEGLLGCLQKSSCTSKICRLFLTDPCQSDKARFCPGRRDDDASACLRQRTEALSESCRSLRGRPPVHGSAGSPGHRAE